MLLAWVSCFTGLPKRDDIAVKQDAHIVKAQSYYQNGSNDQFHHLGALRRACEAYFPEPWVGGCKKRLCVF